MGNESLGSDDYFQKYMPGEVCFGCGTENSHGLQIHSFWEGEECVCIWKPDERYQGWSKLTCGGIIATLIDCHCMASAMATAIRKEGRALGSDPQYRFATGTLHIKFLKPTPISVPLLLRARVVNIRNERIYTLSCNLYADHEKTVEAEVTAFLVYSSDQTDSVNSVFTDESSGIGLKE